MTEDPQSLIKASCIRLLSRREHSQSELLKKLSAKGFAVADIERVIAEMVSAGWQSDQRFFDAFVRQRIGKGFGPVRIDHELKQRGLDRCCQDLADLPDWNELIESVYIKKYSLAECRLSRTVWAKRMRFLQQRGFSGEMIRRLFDHLDLKFE